MNLKTDFTFTKKLNRLKASIHHDFIILYFAPIIKCLAVIKNEVEIFYQKR